MRDSSWSRIIIVSLLLFATWSYTHNFSRVPEMSLNRPLLELPMHLGEFHGHTLRLSDEVSKVLGPADIISREYVGTSGEKVDLYVSYHGKQTSKSHPHSPRMCMPASGWVPSGNAQKSISLSDGGIVRAVRAKYVKGLDQMIVLYWYQTGRRYMTTEYLQKLYMVIDGIFRRRTDIAFVRVSALVDREGLAAAEKRLENFVKVFVPALNQILPE